MNKEKYEQIINLYEENIKKTKKNGKKDCITILRYVLDTVYEKKTPMRGDRITEDIIRLEKAKYIDWTMTINSLDKNRKITSGVTRPMIFSEDWSRFLFPYYTSMIESSAFNVYILSIMDGYHAVMLLSYQEIGDRKKITYLDNNEIVNYTKYSCSAGLSIATLTTDISKKMTKYWDIENDKGKKFKSNCILAKLRI